MRAKFDTLVRRPRYGISLFFLAVLAYNNWLLGPYLNRALFDKNGSVSEFSALTQPHYWFFRCLDIFSGLLLVLVSLVLAKLLAGQNLARKVLVYGTAALGLANVLDASFTLPCSETLNAGCNIPISLSLSHFQLPDHAYSSVVIGICYLVLPMAGLVYAAGRKLNLLMLVSALATAVAIESLLAILLQYFSKHAFSVRASGDSQELQMLVLAVWFICLSWSVYAKSRQATALRYLRVL